MFKCPSTAVRLEKPSINSSPVMPMLLSSIIKSPPTVARLSNPIISVNMEVSKM